MSDNVRDGLSDGRSITDVDLVESNVDASVLRELASSLLTDLWLDIENGETTDTNLSKSLSHVQAEAASTTGDDGDLADQGEFLKSWGHLTKSTVVEGTSALVLVGAGRGDWLLDMF